MDNHTGICLARRRIWIQDPHFIPEPDAIEAFGRAVRRGMDMRVLMPSTSGSDNPMVQHPGHRNFEKLLRCGVRLFEYPDTLLHQKVYSGPGGSNGWVGDPIDAERAERILATFSGAATATSMEAIGVSDAAGFCSDCGKFYCPVHWDGSATGYGRCPQGHGKSLDPHWYPEYPEPED